MFKVLVHAWRDFLCGLGFHAYGYWVDRPIGVGLYQLRRCAHCRKTVSRQVY